MWRNLTAILLAATLAGPIQANIVVKRRGGIAPGGNPSCTTTINDDFTGYSNYADHWSTQIGPYNIVSNELVSDNDSVTGGRVAVHDTTLGSADQWAKVLIQSKSDTTIQGGVAFRFTAYDYTNGSYIAVVVDANTLYVEKHHTTSYDGDIVSPISVTVPSTPYYLASNVTGTGSSIVIKVWLSAGDPGSCPSDWGAATVTVNSSSTGFASGNVVDTGNYAGIFAYFPSSSAINLHYKKVLYGTGT